jgi:hypothetical protein
VKFWVLTQRTEKLSVPTPTPVGPPSLSFHEAERLFAVGPGPARKWPPVAFGAVVGLR